MLLAIVGVCFLFLAVGPRTGRYRTLNVLSNSMQPTWSAGDLLVSTPQPASAVAVGQSITFTSPPPDRALITHRVIEVVEGGDRPVVRTKGDANLSADPWDARLEAGPVWRVRVVVPKAGYLLLALNHPRTRLLTTTVAPVLLALFLLVHIWRPEPDVEAVGA